MSAVDLNVNVETSWDSLATCSQANLLHDYGRTDGDAKILHNCGDGEVPEKMENLSSTL